MTTPSLCAHQLRKSFGRGPQRVSALRDVSIEFRPGMLTLMRGPSGSGKSTLVAVLGGLLAPDAGAVSFGPHEVWSSPKAARRFRREACGFVFQSAGLFPALSALDQIAVPLRALGRSTAESERSAQQALEAVGLGDRTWSLPSELSGGQNQRVAIARMIAKQPQILLCDEPTSALDRSNGQALGALLRDVSRRGAVVLCMTHDDRLLPFADRIIDMEDGAVTHDSAS